MSRYKLRNASSAQRGKSAHDTKSISLMRGEGLSSESLKNEEDFITYLAILRDFSKRYCCIVVAMDTPCGESFSPESALAMRNAGFQADLYGKFRCSYAAVINAGELIFEELAEDVLQPVEKHLEIAGRKIDILSVGFQVRQKTEARIAVDDEEVCTGRRGLNFVVCDLVTGTLIDQVNFDTYVRGFPCRRPSARVDAMRKIRQAMQGVSFYTFGVIPFPNENLTENERYIQQHALSSGMISTNVNTYTTALDQYYDKREIMETLVIPRSYHDANGVRRFEDYRSGLVNTLGGHRVTDDQPPTQSGRTIFLVGGCSVFGIGADDGNTIASHLQRIVNVKYPEENIIVQNYGFYLAEMDGRGFTEELAIIRALPIKEGDIVLYGTDDIDGIPSIDVKNYIERDGAEIFFDQMHYTPDGYRLIAKGLFAGLEKQGYLRRNGGEKGNVSCTHERYGFNRSQSEELTKYKGILRDYYAQMFCPEMGAIVMNANPFTLGHRYLVEQALTQCGWVAIFVVEENKSMFSFDERLAMVDEGVKDLEQVVVIPSGRFIISSLTFAEYFNKSELQDRIIDPSMDVLVFAREIAPCLHITKRFVGEEPFDEVTRQYNATMKKILPEYGIELIEIPRKKTEREVISASLVRELMQQGNLERIRQIVPIFTFEYLKRLNGRTNGG